MNAKHFKILKDNINTVNKVIEQLDLSVKNMDDVLSGVIDGLEGVDRQKAQELTAHVNRIIAKAKKGEPYDEAIQSIRDTFKNDIKK